MAEQVPPERQVAIETFNRLSEVYPVGYVSEMSRLLEETMARFSSAESKYLAPNLKLVHALEEKCKLLLSKYEHLKPHQQALVVGAVRYFIVGADEFPDHAPLSGLDDDVFIMNMVLEKLGMGESAIDLLGYTPD